MTNSQSSQGAQVGEPRTVALVQEHRGHGVSTAAYHLTRALVADGLRVLVVDLTGRRGRLQTLLAHGSLKNAGLWAPPPPQPSDLSQLLAEARRQTAGRVDVLLLDADASLVEHAGGLAIGIDYAVVVTAATLEGQHAADRIAERLGDAPPPYGKVGVVFSRVSASEAGELKEQTENRKTPVLGHYPADYLLAAGDDYSVSGVEPSEPHEKYLLAMGRLARMLTRRVPLRRLTTAAKPAQSAQSAKPTPALVDAAVTPARVGGAGTRMANAPARAALPGDAAGMEPQLGA